MMNKMSNTNTINTVALICLRKLTTKETEMIMHELLECNCLHLIGNQHTKHFMDAFWNTIIYPEHTIANRLIIGDTGCNVTDAMAPRRMLTTMMLTCNRLIFIPEKFTPKSHKTPNIWAQIDGIIKDGKQVEIYVNKEPNRNTYKAKIKVFEKFEEFEGGD